MQRVLGIVLAGCYLLTSASSQRPCFYYQTLLAGTTYYLYSPNYPAFYSWGTKCQWHFESLPGSTIVLNCFEVRLPQSLSCRGDHMAVSIHDVALSDAHRYCGVGDFLVESEANRLGVLLSVGDYYSPGGRFACSLTPRYRTPSCDCGWNQKPRIVGGTETSPNEYPMMAGLVDSFLRIVYCGSTVISNRFVLTAAHCLLERTPAKVGVLVGEHDTRIGNETGATRLILAEEFALHPDYDPKTEVNDIALVRVTQDIVFSNEVGPACLPIRFSSNTFQGELVTVLGWGTTDFGGSRSPTLQQVGLKVINRQDCATKLHGNVVTDNQLCTFTVDQDACQSDSGGPVLWQDPATGRLHLAGVISYGVGCGSELPGVNTRVGAYIDWIKQATKTGDYCVK